MGKPDSKFLVDAGLQCHNISMAADMLRDMTKYSLYNQM
jgi:hypothetical protein